MATSQLLKIVNLTAQLTASPQPSQLQQSEALVSVGGSTLATGSFQFCSADTAVQSIISTVGNFAELTNMATDFFAQGTAVGVYVLELGVQTSTEAGIAALNAWITANPNVFYSFAVPADWDSIPAPSATTVAVTAATSTLPAGTYYTQIAYLNSSGTIGQLSPMATSIVSTGSTDELTVSSPAVLIGATDYLVYMGTSSTNLFLQNSSAGTAIGTPYNQSAPILTAVAPSLTLADMGNNFSSPTSKVYFYVESSSTNVAAYGVMDANSIWAGYKAIIAVVPSPAAQAGEFDSAAWLYNIAVNNPGANNKLAPMSYRYLTGVNPWPATGYSSQIQTIANYGGNWVGTGAEGGIAQNCIFKGTTSSLAQISSWYGMDWLQIQIKQALAAAVINGSNSNPPLLYDQAGINTLQAIAQDVADNAVKFGCVLSAVVSAIPFYEYATQQPSDYASGIYSGLSCNAVFQNGFLNLNFFLDAIQFVAAA